MWARNFLLLASGLIVFAGGARSVVDSFVADRPASIELDLASIRATAARIDARFEQQWQAAGIAPAPEATDLLIARRLALALTGTIPSLEEIRRFERVPADRRLDHFLSQRLADRRTADYLAERFARAWVGVEEGPFLLFRRRRFVTWLADQLHAGRPYDEIVHSVIADDGLWTDRPAVNFVTVTINPGDENKPDANRLAGRVARAMLGVRLDCAECHDHPFADWKQQDFRQLAAFFASTRQGLRGIRDETRHDAKEHEPAGDETISPLVPFLADKLPAEGGDRQRLAAWVTDDANRPFARAAVNRVWALLFGRPLVEPLEDVPLDGPRPEVLDLLADDFIAHGHDLRRLVAVIAQTQVFRLDSRLEHSASEPLPEQSVEQSVERFAELETHWAVFPLTRLRPEQIVGGVMQSASLPTIDYESNLLVRTIRAVGQSEFIERYGDAGADELAARGGTASQRLVLMNGDIVFERTKDDLLSAAASQIAAFAPDDASAVETAFLAVLTRRPGQDEAEYFAGRLRDTRGSGRNDRLNDLYWALLNGTEFSWNH